MEVLLEEFSAARRMLIFATTRDKDFHEMLKLLLAKKGSELFFKEIVFTKYTSNPRALLPEELEAAAHQISGRHFPIFANPADAWNHIRNLANADDLICITGSFFLAGEMRRIINAIK